MSKNLTYQIENLKKDIFLISGSSVDIPSDCKTLAEMVFDKTQKRISETTFKRLYGFALTRYAPSLFTLDTLAKYCNYDSWGHFLIDQNHRPVNTLTATMDWDNLKTNAHKMTALTLQALKNRSGIPYNMTIKRKFIDDHFEDFLSSKYKATILVAPAGHGKTLALCHWIEEKMALTASNDIILFFSYSALLNAHFCGRDLNDWLFSLMGYSCKEDFITLLKAQQEKGGSFFLMIDGVDENMFKGGQFQLLINQLVDIIFIYQANEYFKLVLTMRPSTWINNYSGFENERDMWFLGDLINQNQPTNVPLLNIQEINELARKINPAIQENSSNNIVEILSCPLYFQFYYKQHRNNFTLEKLDEAGILGLISKFISEKVYTGPLFAEKSFLIRALVEKMDLKEGQYKVNKCKVIDLIKKYNNAYTELLSIGFLQEFHTGYDILYKTNIEFGNTFFLEFSIAKTLLFTNKDLFDSRLIYAVNQFLNYEIKPGVIKWYLIHTVKMAQYNNLQLLPEIKLTTNDKLNIISFLSDLLNNDLLKIDENAALTLYFKRDCNQALFNYYFGLELMTSSYSKSLEVLLKHKLSNKKKILLYSALATSSVIKLDLNNLEKYINLMSAFPGEDYLEFPINPLNCLNAIYSYFKYGIIKKECFEEITQFYFNPPIKRDGFRDSSTNDLLYLIGVITVKICQNSKKTLRFINVVNSHYRTITDIPSAYSFLLKVAMIDEYLTMGKIKEGLKIYNSLQETFNENKKNITPFMESLFSTARIIISVYCKQYAHMLTDVRIVNIIADKFDNRLFKIYALSLLLKNENSNIHNPTYKQVFYDYKRIIRKTQLNPQLFLENQVFN